MLDSHDQSRALRIKNGKGGSGEKTALLDEKEEMRDKETILCTALGTINSEIIEYLMGHVTDTYNDVSSLGIEYLRNLYANSGLSIRPKTKLDMMETLKGIVKSFGMDPDKILSKETMMKPYRTIIDRRENEERMMILQKTIKNAIIDEIKSADSSAWSMVARRRFELRSEASKAPTFVP